MNSSQVSFYCKKTGCFLILFLIVSTYTFALKNTSLKNGNWCTTPSSNDWSLGQGPADGQDTIVIATGHTITIIPSNSCNVNSTTYNKMYIQVYGTLKLTNGAKLQLDADGIIDVLEGGLIFSDSNGNGEKIAIGTKPNGNGPNYIWEGNNGSIVGPKTLSKNGLGPLPVNLLFFNAEQQNEKITLRWATSTELNNDYFSIERSEDAANWQKVAIVKGGENSNSKKEYRIEDEISTEQRTSTNTIYYQLRQRDFDGTEKVFPMIAIQLQSSPMLHLIPNPTSEYVIVEGLSENLNTLQLINSLGQLQELFPVPGKSNVFDTNGLSNGIYFVSYTTSAHKTILHKLFIVH